jgi:hypothetical protein
LSLGCFVVGTFLPIASASGDHKIQSPNTDLADDPFALPPAIASAEAKLKEWLGSVGWNAVNARNLPGYLAEFTFRFNETRRGSTAGWRFIRLLRQALSVNIGTPSTGTDLDG